jgi:hypothetical protein
MLPLTIQQDIKAYIHNKNTPNKHNIRLHRHSVVKTVNGETVADSISLSLNMTNGVDNSKSSP